MDREGRRRDREGGGGGGGGGRGGGVSQRISIVTLIFTCSGIPLLKRPPTHPPHPHPSLAGIMVVEGFGCGR